MSSREKILQAIREHRLPDVDLPELQRDEWTRFSDPADQFVTMVPAVGGTARRYTADDVSDGLPFAQIDASQRTYSMIPELKGNVELDAIDDPHELEDVEYCLVRAELGVAENGAIWITDRAIKHRAVLFIAQHVIVVVAADAIVNNMHEAYARLQLPEAIAAQRHFGVFISGPSKTADIEQSLVIGAHGPRSLQAVVVG